MQLLWYIRWACINNKICCILYSTVFKGCQVIVSLLRLHVVKDKNRLKDDVFLYCTQTTDSTYSLSGLRARTTYTVTIRARTQVGYGPYSDQYTVTTPSVMTSSASPAELHESDQQKSILVAVCGGILLMFVLVVLTLQYKRTGRILCLNASHGDLMKAQVTSHSGQNQALLNERLIGKTLTYKL